jgi:hypothetical protein
MRGSAPVFIHRLPLALLADMNSYSCWVEPAHGDADDIVQHLGRHGGWHLHFAPDPRLGVQQFDRGRAYWLKLPWAEELSLAGCSMDSRRQFGSPFPVVPMQ